MFVSTDARWPYPHGVIGSTVGAYPRGAGSNPVEGNGHFFPSYRQLYLSSLKGLSLTHTGTNHPDSGWVKHFSLLSLIGRKKFANFKKKGGKAEKIVF